MAKHQDREWFEAQKIVISTNLIVAAKKHLQFLEAVESNGNLYEGSVLEKAIFRYKYCWLPMLAKHTESKLAECELVIPLDCEWIWHCHRLNPVRYMEDCKELFGRILDPDHVVVSSIEGTCKKHTEEIWKKLYPGEPYELDSNDHLKTDTQINLRTSPSTNYDLISAVKRQSSFYHKVSGTSFKDDIYLEEAVQRYKGFLYLVKRNMEMRLKNPCVPTYDIDLMWHSHQLHPLSYCKDVLALVGRVLHHDDTDTDKSKGGKLDVGIKTTTKQWVDMFGSIYWRVGSMASDTTMSITEAKLSAMNERSRCMVEVIGGDNLIAVTERSRCMAEVIRGENLSAVTARSRCMNEVIGGENLTAVTARCWCLAEDMDQENLSAMTARCWCLVDDVDEEKLSGRSKAIEV